MAPATTPRFRSPADPAPAPVPVVADDRDYLTEVREEVNDYLDSHGTVVSAQAAEELVARWAVSDPDLLDGWLRTRSRQILRDYIYATSLSRGARSARVAQQGRFAQFSDGFNDALKAGGPEGAREFFRFHTVTEGPIAVRKPLGDLNASQVGEVRDRYRQAAADNAFMGKVLEKVRMRVAAKGEDAVVADVYSPEQLEKMFNRGEK